MTRVVVDASVAIKWFVPEELSPEARRLLDPGHELVAPDRLGAELGNALWKRSRRGELDQQTARRLLRDFSRLPLAFHAAERWVNAALELSIRHGVTVYDGLYLALAAGCRGRVVTADRRLRDASRVGALRDLVAWVGELD